MSERQEKKKRYNLRLQLIAEFEKWLADEPNPWRIFSYHRWKKSRPKWEDYDA